MQSTDPSASPVKKSALPNFLANILDSSAAPKDRNDPFRFQVGVNFKAKIIGITDVPEARGDRMCQEVIQKEKLAVKASGQHKQQVILNISLEGIRVIDQASMNAIHQHAVHRISFISRDVSDARAFGYVYGPGDGTHKFFAIKTEKAAENTVLALRDLFQTVFELKKQETEAKKKAAEEGALTSPEPPEKQQEAKVAETPEPSYPAPAQPQSSEADLFGLVDLGSLNKNLEEMSFDPMSAATVANPGGEPTFKNPPLGDLEESDPFAVNSPTSSTSGGPGGWAAFNTPQPTSNAFGAGATQSLSPSMSSSSGDMFSAASPFGGAAPAATNSGPFGAPQTTQPFGAPAAPMSGGPFGAPVGGPFGAPTAGGMQGGFGAAPGGPFGAPATSAATMPGMGNPMMGGGMPPAPSANPFASPGGMFGGMPDTNAQQQNPMSNGFGSPLAPLPAPGTQTKDDKAKGVDPLFGDLVGSFSADLGQKKKDEFFKPGPGPKMNELRPQVSEDNDVFDSGPFNQDVFKNNAKFNTSEMNSPDDSDLNSPEHDIPAPNIPPPPLPAARTFSSSSSQVTSAPSLPPRPSQTGRQTSNSSVSSQLSTSSKSTFPSVSGKFDFSFPSDPPPAPPPRPRPSMSQTSTLSGQGSTVTASSTKASPQLSRQGTLPPMASSPQGSPSLVRQTTLPATTSTITESQTPPAPPMRKQFSFGLPPEGATPPPLPTCSPPQLATNPPPSPAKMEDTPPPPPPRPGLSYKRTPKLGDMSRAMTVPEQPTARPRPQPNADDKDNERKITSNSDLTIMFEQKPSDPFAVTLPKTKSRNIDSGISRARPRPRSKTPTGLSSNAFSLKSQPYPELTDTRSADESEKQNTHLPDTASHFESQPIHVENKFADFSPTNSFKVDPNFGLALEQRTDTPLSVHSVGSADHVIDPFENIDPFEKDGEDPFSNRDPFEDNDPFADTDPFSNDLNQSEFHTKAVSAEGVPLRTDSRNAERRRKGEGGTLDKFTDDPFSLTIDPLQGKNLDKPLIGDGRSDTRNSLMDPFDTAFATATLSTTSITPQFNNCDTNATQKQSNDVFTQPFHTNWKTTDSSTFSFSKDISTIDWSDGNVRSDPPPSSNANRARLPSASGELVGDVLSHDASHNGAQHESDSASYNSEVSEAFASTPRSQACHSSAATGNTPPSGSGRATPGNPFLPQAPIPPQAAQPPPPGATLLDF